MTLEHFTVDEARQILPARYIGVAFISTWVWDTLVSLSSEIRVFSDRRLRLVDVVYMLSRILTGITIFAALPPIVTPVKHCGPYVVIVCWCATGSVWLNTSHFLFRANSVFAHSRWGKMVFGVMWLLTTISILVIPFSFNAARIEPGHLCAITRVGKLATIPPVSVGVFHITIYVSISYGTIRDGVANGRVWMLRTFFTGLDITPTAKALLRTGQIYFSTVVVVESCVLSVEYLVPLKDSVLLQYKAAAIFGSVISMNAMTCRVFRLLRLDLGIFGDTPGSSMHLSTMHFPDIHTPTGDSVEYIEATVEGTC